MFSAQTTSHEFRLNITSAKCANKGLSLVISYWIHEKILMSTFRWLTQKKWYEFRILAWKICIHFIPSVWTIRKNKKNIDFAREFWLLN